MPAKTYLLLCPSARLVKIGKSINPTRRMLDLRTMNAAELEPLLVFKVEEAWLHAKFADLRHHGEWFCCDARICDYLDSITEHDAADRLRLTLKDNNAQETAV